MGAGRLSRVLLAGGLLLAAGCGTEPTYRKDTLVPSLDQILKHDGVDARVRLLDHTIAVQFSAPQTLTQQGGQITLGPKFDEAVRTVLIATHRVLLSSDADIRFYVLLMSDPAVPGAYLTLARYVDDVKRANANMIDTPEIYSRTVFDLNFVGPQSVTLERYVPRDIKLEEFLSWQLARRIQQALAERLAAAGVAEVGRCGGEFRNGEFLFTLNVIPPENQVLPDETMQQIFRTSSEVVAKVLSSYKFEAFQAVRFTHPITGRNLVLPKTNLELFR